MSKYRWYLLPPVILLNLVSAQSLLPRWWTPVVVLAGWSVALLSTVGVTEVREFITYKKGKL